MVNHRYYVSRYMQIRMCLVEIEMQSSKGLSLFVGSCIQRFIGQHHTSLGSETQWLCSADTSPRGSSHWDQFTCYRGLSAQLIHGFCKYMQCIFQEFKISDCSINLLLHSPSGPLTLTGPLTQFHLPAVHLTVPKLFAAHNALKDTENVQNQFKISHYVYAHILLYIIYELTYC